MAERLTPSAERLAALRARAVVSLAEAGELTGLSRSSLCRLIRDGRLPARKVGARVLLHPADLRFDPPAGDAA